MSQLTGAVFISCKTLLLPTMVSSLINGFRVEASKSGQTDNRDSTPFFLTAMFVSELVRLDDIYRPMRSQANRRQLFLLQYLHANLNLFADFLEKFANDYVESRRRDFDPRSSKLRRWVLKEIARDSNQYRQLTNIGNEMSDTLESLIDIVKALPKNKGLEPEPKIQFLTLEQELRGCCKDIRGRLSRLTDDLESSLKFLDLARNMSQTSNVQFLTVLATIFLPLSLAAGVLSMQSRFKDLGVLLYDFFGVVFLLATIGILILVSMVFWDFIEENATKLITENYYKPVWAVLVIVAGLGILVFGMLVLSSFLVGMFKDVVLGAHILGYGFAVAIGGPVAICLLILVWSIVMEALESTFERIGDMVASWNNDNRTRKRRDIEGDPVPGIQQNVQSDPGPRS
jgi:hypothetical protein